MRKLELFTHACCFSRENGVALILRVMQHFPDISFREVRISDEPERAKSLGIRMAPALVLDGKIISFGIPDEEDLFRILGVKSEDKRDVQKNR